MSTRHFTLQTMVLLSCPYVYFLVPTFSTEWLSYLWVSEGQVGKPLKYKSSEQSVTRVVSDVSKQVLCYFQRMGLSDCQLLLPWKPDQWSQIECLDFICLCRFLLLQSKVFVFCIWFGNLHKVEQKVSQTALPYKPGSGHLTEAKNSSVGYSGARLLSNQSYADLCILSLISLMPLYELTSVS